MKRCSRALSVGFFLLAGAYLVCAEDGSQHTAIVLFGATGNLATKYLWQSIFNVYNNIHDLSIQRDGIIRQSNHSFSLMGVGRSVKEKGSVMLNSKISNNVKCDVGFYETLSSLECDKRKKSFIKSIEYVQFTDDSQGHVRFCDEIQKTISAIKVDKKINLIMYMAISTTAYVSFLENFKTTCYKNILQSNVDIRWALEKPFGMDKLSANSFADRLRNSFSEKEIYHVDHYLQKSVVKTILQFRYLNKHLEKVWNKNHIERVEIFLKETLDIKERASFYNNMGVLRDIHQNHLTELLILVSMELPVDIKDTEEISQCKGDLMRHVESVKNQNSLFGQYADYAKHVLLEIDNSTKTSDVPTFAAVSVNINSPRWTGVPFLLVSGKQLDKRESFIRLVFKDRTACVSKCHNSEMEKSRSQIVFHISHGDLQHPSIHVSKSFGKPVWPDNIMEQETTSSDNDLLKTNFAYHMLVGHFYTGLVVKDLNAYHSVIEDLVNGIASHFVTTQRLLLCWHIWDYVVTSEKILRIYEEGDPHGILNFKFDEENHLKFAVTSSDIEKDIDKTKYRPTLNKNSDTVMEDEHVKSETPALFLGWKLVTASVSELSLFLADAIANVAKGEVKIKGSFHIALSGGSSIAPVLHSLAHSFFSLPWDSIHVWQVDERCVPHHEKNSNFGMLDRELFRHVNIPFSNIHAMPVDIAGDLCDESLGGSHLYTESIKTHVLNTQLDMVILGLGTDGHTASLFPGSTALHVDSDTFVTITDDGPDDTIRRRMSLTLPLINRSKHIAVLVTGHHKKDILQRLESSTSLDKFPILGVHPVNGTVRWYIDDLALPL